MSQMMPKMGRTGGHFIPYAAIPRKAFIDNQIIKVVKAAITTNPSQTKSLAKFPSNKAREASTT